MKKTKFVICIENSEYLASLETRKIYQVLPDENAKKTGHIRIIDESGDDYLYPASCFIDAQLPQAVRDAIVNAA